MAEAHWLLLDAGSVFQKVTLLQNPSFQVTEVEPSALLGLGQERAIGKA